MTTIYDRIRKEPELAAVRRLTLMQVVVALERDLEALLVTANERNQNRQLNATDAYTLGTMHGSVAAAIMTVRQLFEEPPDSRLEGKMAQIEWTCRKCHQSWPQRLRDYHIPEQCPACDAKLALQDVSMYLRFDDGTRVPERAQREVLEEE